MRIWACVFLALATLSWGSARASDKLCLTDEDVLTVARMGSVMGLGGALNRCGRCLGERFKPAVRTYETSGLLLDFRKSEATTRTDPARFAYADDLVRVTARRYASEMSGDCNACSATVDTLEKLASADARTTFYTAAAKTVTSTPEYRSCP